jgi:hypothetical protein
MLPYRDARVVHAVVDKVNVPPELVTTETAQLYGDP